MDELEKKLREIAKNAPKHKNTDNKAEKYECPDCEDTGWIYSEDKQGRTTAKHCKCYAVRQARVLMDRSGIANEFRSKCFENYETRDIPQLVNAKSKAICYCQTFQQYEKDRHNSILLSGQVGAGKTHLGTAICATLMNNGIAVVYMPYRNAVTRIKQHLIDEDEYQREVNSYSEARVLYIDDLLKGRTTEADTNILYEIVNYRYMNNLPIIVSTEKLLEELLDFDEAIGSRIIEMCRGNIVELHGKELNYRLN